MECNGFNIHAAELDSHTGLSKEFQDDLKRFTNKCDLIESSTKEYRHPKVDGEITLKFEFFIDCGSMTSRTRSVIIGSNKGREMARLQALDVEIPVNMRPAEYCKGCCLWEGTASMVSEMERIEVSTRFLRCGVGRAMVEYMIEKLKEKGATLSVARPFNFRQDGASNYTPNGGSRAVAFFKAMGYYEENGTHLRRSLVLRSPSPPGSYPIFNEMFKLAEVDPETGLSEAFQKNLDLYDRYEIYEPTENSSKKHPIPDGQITLDFEIFHLCCEKEDPCLLITASQEGKERAMLSAKVYWDRDNGGGTRERATAAMVLKMMFLEVSANYLRLGIGRAMVEYMIENAKKMGATVSHVRAANIREDGESNTTSDGRIRAAAFWEAMGYVPQANNFDPTHILPL